jgi:hypothetical protein
MDAGAHVDAGLVGESISILLPPECLDVAVTILVDIICDPGFAVLVPGSSPGAFANGHSGVSL